MPFGACQEQNKEGTAEKGGDHADRKNVGVKNGTGSRIADCQKDRAEQERGGDEPAVFPPDPAAGEMGGGQSDETDRSADRNDRADQNR